MEGFPETCHDHGIQLGILQAPPLKHTNQSVADGLAGAVIVDADMKKASAAGAVPSKVATAMPCSIAFWKTLWMASSSFTLARMPSTPRGSGSPIIST